MTASTPGRANGHASGSSREPLVLPSTLLATTLRQFDTLITEGLVMYESSTPSDFHTTSGFCLQLRVSPSLLRKPVLAPAEARSAANPFLNPDPKMVIIDKLGPPKAEPGPSNKSKPHRSHNGVALASLAPRGFPDSDSDSDSDETASKAGSGAAKHRLMMNKFCIYRPQLLITTREFASQADDLDADDLEACWAVMAALSGAASPSENTATAKHRQRFMMIYNAGRQSGNSQPHKHMQVFPEPPPDEHVLYFNPADPGAKHVGSRAGVALWSRPNVPFWYVSARLPERGLYQSENGNGDDAAAAETPSVEADRSRHGGSSFRDALFHVYVQLLAETRDELRANDVAGAPSYNVIMTLDTMVLVPRRRAGSDGLMLNAAGMAGLVWLSRDFDHARWTPPRLEAHLETCGLPRRPVGAER